MFTYFPVIKRFVDYFKLCSATIAQRGTISYSVVFSTLLLPFRYASSVKDGSQYFVLLIVTDGVISDMAQTKESIVNVSRGHSVLGWPRDGMQLRLRPESCWLHSETNAHAFGAGCIVNITQTHLYHWSVSTKLRVWITEL